MNNNRIETPHSDLHKQTLIVAFWLEGTITGIQSDASDSDLIITY